jgi:hypothetical protein
MAMSKLPPPADREDFIEDFATDQAGGRYIIEQLENNEVIASGLTRRETVEFTWLYAGRDYRIEPRMGTLHDESGCNTGIRLQAIDVFGAEWDVYFKDGSDRPWRKSKITAYGPTERAAIIDLLEAGFKRKVWTARFYVRDIRCTDLRWLDAHLAQPSLVPVGERREHVGQ